MSKIVSKIAKIAQELHKVIDECPVFSSISGHFGISLRLVTKDRSKDKSETSDA